MSATGKVTDTKMLRRMEEDRLGRDIIDECRVQLMLKFRFLDLALWKMELEPMRVGANYPLTTDAKRVVYDPPRVVGRFQESFEESVRDYLHLVMHCIFRHPFDEDHDNAEAWSLTCDMLVESAVMDMCGGRFPSEDDKARREVLSQIQMMTGKLLPGKVYSLLKSIVLIPEGQQYRGYGRSHLNEWHALFERDEHAAWPANNKSRNQDEKSDEPQEVTEDDENPDVQADSTRMESAGESQQQDAQQQEQQQDAPAQDEGQQETDEGEEDQAGDDAADASLSSEDNDEKARAQDEKDWEEIAKQIEMNLETFSKEWGEEAGSLMATLELANRKTYAYTDFLRKFMVVTEEMQLNMDEFDYIYYTFGLDTYGNMPLIEPLEYKETERVHDFAIVIDTSESVSGDLVRRFITHTFDILKSSQDYAREVNIHVIQCDARVQSDLKITDMRDIDKLMESFVIRGFGGTDFRPAFDYVEMLRKRGELADIKGLIYFTDGLGQFPEKPPEYDAAFVFMNDEGVQLPPVPPWAMKIVIDEAAIHRLKPESTGKTAA